jgi:hypothetical protein
MKYTINEIDEMRHLVVMSCVAGSEYEKCLHPEDVLNMSRVEEVLRTHMLNGTTLSKMRKHVAKKLKKG